MFSVWTSITERMYTGSNFNVTSVVRVDPSKVKRNVFFTCVHVSIIRSGLPVDERDGFITRVHVSIVRSDPSVALITCGAVHSQNQYIIPKCGKPVLFVFTLKGHPFVYLLYYYEQHRLWDNHFEIKFSAWIITDLSIKSRHVQVLQLSYFLID